MALICDWYAPRRGGIETHLGGLAEHLHAIGHEVHVVTSTPGPAPAIGDIRVHRLPGPRVPGANVAFRGSTFAAIRQILHDHRIEVAHAHVSIVAPVGIGGALQAQRARVPTVVTFHSFVPGTRVWARGAGWLVGANRWNAVFTAVSPRVAREIQPFAADHDVGVLPNAVDLDYWAPVDRPNRDSVLTAVVVGRLQSKKRPMLALEAATALRRRDPSYPFRVLVIGAGPLEPTLRRYADSEQLGSRVEFMGWKGPGEVRALVREADIFLSPAVRESFGIAALEARAAGIPVIGMRDSALPAFIESGESGLLADSDDAFVASFVLLATDATLRNRIAAHNRLVRPAFDWNHSLRLHLAAYDRARELRSRSLH